MAFNDTHEMLCALMDALSVTNRRARSALVEIFNLSSGSPTPFPKSFEYIGSRMIGSNKPPRAKQNAVSYALGQLGSTPLLKYATKNTGKKKKRSTFECNWALVEQAFEIVKTLDFQPRQRQESYAAAACLALESAGFVQNVAPNFSIKTFPSAEQIERRIRKAKATIKTLTGNIIREVHTLGLSPDSDIQELINHCYEKVGKALPPEPPRGSLRHNIILSVNEFEVFPPSPDELDQIGLILSSDVKNPSVTQVVEEVVSPAAELRVQRLRSLRPQTHALAEFQLYRDWGLRYLKKTELSANDECQDHAHKFPLKQKRLAQEHLERANSNRWSVIIRPPHIIRTKTSGIGVIHLDDLPFDLGMKILASFGGILKETSPDNYQVLLPIYGVTYLALFERLSRGLIAGTGADPGANGATRLCGSLNIKLIHETKLGGYPMVRAVAIGRGCIRTVSEALASPFYVHVEPQITLAPISDQSVTEWSGDVPAIEAIERRVIAAGYLSGKREHVGRASQSHVHFRFVYALALRMIRRGKLNRTELQRLLLRESPSARERWARTPNYINRTIEKAIARASVRAQSKTIKRSRGAAA